MQSKLISSLLLLILSIPAFAPAISEEQTNRWWTTVKASTPEERTAITCCGMPIDEFDDTTVSGIATQEVIDQLVGNKFEICGRESLATESKKLVLQRNAALYHYTTYREMVDDVQKMAATHPDIISYFSAGQSIQGREILVIRINTTEKGTAPSSKSGILLIGNHHAREHISAEFCLQCAHFFAQHKNEARIKSLIADRDIFIMPMANPDGIEYDLSTFPYKYHRKNMRPLPNRARGIDLNRNYDIEWGGLGASQQPQSEIYCGSAAFSEPETTAIKELIEAHANIRLMISYHSFGKYILYPWGYTRKRVDNAEDLQKYMILTKGMVLRLPEYTVMQASAMYIVSGEAADWSYASNDILSLTIEMMPRTSHSANGFYPMNKEEIAEDIQNNIAAALFAIEFAGTIA